MLSSPFRWTAGHDVECSGKWRKRADVERAEVFELVKVEAARVLDVPVERIVESARFIADLGADSLDLVEILVPLEEALGIDCGQGGLDHVVTVGDFLDHVVAGVPVSS